VGKRASIVSSRSVSRPSASTGTSTAIAPVAANVCLAIRYVPMQRRESKKPDVDFPALPFPYSIAQDDRINRCYGYGEDFMGESTCPMVKC